VPSGYDKFNAEQRIDWLAGIQGVMLPIAGLRLLLPPVSVAVLMDVLVADRRGDRRGR
jgi:hypothetical protein